MLFIYDNTIKPVVTRGLNDVTTALPTNIEANKIFIKIEKYSKHHWL